MLGSMKISQRSPTGLAVGERYDLTRDRRSAQADLLGVGDSRAVLWARYEELYCHRPMEATVLDQRYAQFELQAYRSTRHLPSPWRAYATRAVMAVQLRLGSLCSLDWWRERLHRQ